MASFTTLVTGIPRSGTSLMMQMLCAGGMPVLRDASRAPDADNPRGYFELEAVRHTQRNADWLEAAAGHAVKVVHLLVPELPADRPYRVISMHRALDEVLDSQREMLRRRGVRRRTTSAVSAAVPIQTSSADTARRTACDTVSLREAWQSADRWSLSRRRSPSIRPVV